MTFTMDGEVAAVLQATLEKRPAGAALPKSGHHAARHEHTLIAAAESHMTVSSRGTFSPAELTEEQWA